MTEIIPALLVHDSETFKHHLSLVQNDTDFVQIDVEDGTFVNNKTWFDTVNLIEEDYNVKYFLHLMIDDPVGFITNFPKSEIRHIKGMTAHLETLNEDSLETYVDLLRSLGLEVGVASVNDFGSFDLDIQQYNLDEILVMGVNPGRSGQVMLDDTFARIESANNEYASIVAVDGNVNVSNMSKLIKSGATRLYLSSEIFDSKDPNLKYKKLKEIAHEII